MHRLENVLILLSAALCLLGLADGPFLLVSTATFFVKMAAVGFLAVRTVCPVGICFAVEEA